LSSEAQVCGSEGNVLSSGPQVVACNLGDFGSKVAVSAAEVEIWRSEGDASSLKVGI